MLSLFLLVITIDPTKLSFGLKSESDSFWDGSVIFYNNTYHLFASRMSYGCGLDTWQTNSECIRATSSSPYENFTVEETVVDSMCHNPSILKFNDTFYLFYIGMYEGSPYKNCTNGTTTGLVPDDLHINPCFIRYKTSTDMRKWSSAVFVYTVFHIPFCPTNPAPIVVNNSIELIYRAYTFSLGSRTFGEYLFRAVKWKDTNHFWDPWIDKELEDPSMIFHLDRYWLFINNKFNNDTYVGSYGTSFDLQTWNFQPLYNLTMIGLEEKRLQRRERPFVLVLNSTNGVLYNSILEYGQKDHVYIQAFPIKFSVN